MKALRRKIGKSRDRSSDAKARPKPERRSIARLTPQGPHVVAKAVTNYARSRRRAIRNLEEMQTTGRITVGDYGKHGAKTGVVVGVTGPKGGACGNPAVAIAWQIRRALTVRPRNDCIVYDAAGQPIAIIDSATRERRPWTAAP